MNGARPAAGAAVPATADPQALLAEAAMHRILRRTLPAQRHEVLGALSALKLQLAVARRRASRTGADPGAADAAGDAADRMAALDAMAQQQQAAQAALTGLRLWDGHGLQRRPLAEVLSQSAAWVCQAAALRGHRLQAPAATAAAAAAAAAATADAADAADAAPQAVVVRVPAAHYLVLGLLYEALDRLQAPAVLTPWLRHDGASGWHIGLEVVPRGDGLPAPAALPATGAAAGTADTISAAMLAALAGQAGSDDGLWCCGPAAPEAAEAGSECGCVGGALQLQLRAAGP